MTFSDLLLSTAILCIAVYILYRSIWKKKGSCPACSGCCCSKIED
ncbi:FeoB-associated Cys-rich membrane protein [Thermodesulfovibrio sp.]